MNDLIIIGSGPSGLTAAIYAARAQLAPLVLEGYAPGGQLMTTTVIENWPGATQGIDGPTLMADMRSQAARFGTRFQSGAVSSVDVSSRPFSITVDGRTLQARCVIVATGASPRLLGLDAEQALMGRGVSVCATCDGFFFRDKTVVVVGGGDTAMEEALYLSGLAATVTVVHRRDALRASKIMQEKVLEQANISFIWESVVVDISDVQRNAVTGVTLKNVHTGHTTDLPCDGVFLALGHIPNTEPFRAALSTDAHGYIRCTGPGTQTSVEGVFAAGDVTDPRYRQAVTAAGMGCMAALDAERYLRETR